MHLTATNNSIHHTQSPRSKPLPQRIIRHVEHYANSGDFVAQIGVLKFSQRGAIVGDPLSPFYGAVFERPSTGHMFNQHYLDPMFEMSGGVVVESNAFMDSWVELSVSAGEEGKGSYEW